MKAFFLFKKGDKYSQLELTIYAGCWLLLFGLPLLAHFYDVIRGDNAEFQWQGIQRSYEILIPIFLLFLINNFVLLPKLFWGHKKWLYFVTLVALLALLWVIQEPPRIEDRRAEHIYKSEMVRGERLDSEDIAMRHSNPPEFRKPRPKGPIDMFHVTNLVIGLCVIFANFAIKMYIHSMRRDVQLLNIQNEKTQQELAALRFQVNPHFLMNTLNNIQSLIEISPVTAYRAIQQLSKMMRYLLYENNAQNVALAKEIEFMQSFIELMKLRYPDTVKVSAIFPEEGIEKSIPPLLFISFIENAFKYGIDYSRDSIITVKLVIEEEWLVFSCANFIAKNMTERKSDSGIGIKNVRRRLDLIYGDEYELDISQNDEKYVVELKLPLNS